MADSSAGILRLPQQDLETFEHFALDASAAAAWAAGLPLGNAGQSATLLREALAALNRVVLAPPQRFALLEALIGSLEQVAATLTRSIISDGALPDAAAQQRSELVAELHELGGAGYALVAVQTIRRPDAIEDINPARLACEALQRAIALRSEELLQSFLLYRPVPLNHWAMLHHLYALAERQQLARLPITDPRSGRETSIAGDYLAGLLIACCRTNQLRQQDIASSFRALRHWQHLARIEDPAVGSGLFVVDLASDRPPIFSKLLQQAPSATQRYLDTAPLVRHLDELRRRDEEAGYRIDRDTRLDSHLCQHLAKALGEVRQRHFNRQPGRHQLWIATGLSAVHYYVAGERTLEQVLHGDDYVPPPSVEITGNPFLKAARDGDSWQRANPQEDFEKPAESWDAMLDVEASLPEDEEEEIPPKRYIVYTVESANVSPGGYCVEWTGLPGGISVGDVVCLREQQQSEGDWAIAVLRWISQVKGAPTLLGLELLSPRGSACAAQVRLPDGDYSGPIRVILLPEITLVGQPPTLLAPRLVFRENQAIILTRGDETFLIRLKRQLASTAAFGQFAFEYRRQLDEDGDGSQETLPGNRFESIWGDL